MDNYIEWTSWRECQSDGQWRGVYQHVKVSVLQWYELINDFALRSFHLKSTLCLHTCIVIQIIS